MNQILPNEENAPPKKIIISPEKENLPVFSYGSSHDEMTVEQEQRLKEFQHMDEKIDKSIVELGLVADRLGEISRRLNSEVKMQQPLLTILVDELNNNVENIEVANRAVKKKIKQTEGDHSCVVS
jgi:archaellum component FlaC